MLLGLRGVGKTVLLNRIEEMASDEGHLPSFIEAPEGKPLGELLVPRLRQVLQKLALGEQAKAIAHLALRALKSSASAFKFTQGETTIMIRMISTTLAAMAIGAASTLTLATAAPAEDAFSSSITSFGTELTECVATVPTVQTSSGTYCGTERRNTQGQTSHAYLGIPFAQPPVGELRWQPPQPITTPTPGVQKATRFGNECVQPSSAIVGFTGNEDCLYLNVYAPKDIPGPLPVMFYIHGGGFFLAQSHVELDGTALANEDVIVVTSNYRLGTLGFMRSPEHDITGNQAIQDQVAALKWVQENIAQFGGDPEQVTAFGESAGAMMVGTLLFDTPEANDLFRAAIMESNIAGAKNLPRPVADKVGKNFVDLLCDSWAPKNCPRTFEWLASLPAEAIAQAQALTLPPGGITGSLVTALANHGYGKWAPGDRFGGTVSSPQFGFALGVKPRPFVYGVNLTEGAFFEPAPLTLTAAGYRAWLRTVVGKSGTAKVLAYKEKGRHIYSPSGYGPLPQGGMTAAAQARARFNTDFGVTIPNMIMVDNALKADIPVFGYHFVQHSSFNFTGQLRCSAASGNVCHTDDIPYVWSQFVEKDQFGFTVPATNVTEEEKQLGARMTGMWASFAKNPGTGFGVPAIRDPYGAGYVKFGGITPFGPALPKSRVDLLLPLYRAAYGS